MFKNKRQSVKKNFLSGWFALLLVSSFAQHTNNIKIYPTNWWVNMKWNKVQLLIKSDNVNFSQEKVRIKYPGISVSKVNKFENGKYLAVDIIIAPTAKPGNVSIDFLNGDKTNTVAWELKSRRKGNGTQYAQGVNSSDFIYFLMPDRFSNGNTANDRIAGMRDQSLNRDSIYLRHGGDMQGIINHLDYIQELGATTLWMTPVLENDMPNRTEHGYAFTDHYTIEPRLGGAEAYKKLSDSLHKRGMKLIQDAVYNHFGLYHFLMQDPPSKDWFHQWPTFTQPNYRDQTLFDPYYAKADRKKMSDGWFTNEMPDVNQNNPFMANYLIQHALWCVEEFGVDGWRIDTYIYLDLPFMNRCNKALTDEYPKMTMFGETWVDGTVNQAYFTQNNIITPFKSNLTGVTDFQCLFAGISPALKNKDGGNALYQTLSNDILYQHPMNNVIFLDNHDMSRFYSEVKEDTAKLKQGIAWLLTERGIPQLYYGTEILMTGLKNPDDGNVRLDFKGGWQGDKENKFVSSGRTPSENSILNWTKTLGKYRINSAAIKTGKLMQYVPADGIYVYFRYDANSTVMIILNTNDKYTTLEMERFKERLNGFETLKNVNTGLTSHIGQTINVFPKAALVLELGK